MQRVWETRRHGASLARPLAKAVGSSLLGGVLVGRQWPVPLLGVLLVTTGALIALRAVWEWERTRLRVTADRLLLVTGTLARRTATVPLSGGAVEIEQPLAGRLLGYGTVLSGDLELRYVPQPRRLLDAATPTAASPPERATQPSSR